MDKNLLERISKRIESYKNDMIEMQKKLISIKAISPVSGGKGELAKAKYLEPIIKNIFTEIEEYHCPRNDAEGGIRPNYIAKLKGKDSSRTMWIMAHMDIVPEGDLKLWNTDPFVATVKDGKIYGRGSEDNHQAIVSGIFVAKAFKEENVTPPVNIGFLLVSDEENGSQYGVEHILKKNKNILGKNDIVVVPDSGDSKGETIEIAEKSTIWLKVTSKGVQAHGSKPQKGVNAHRVGAHFIVKMGDFYKKYDHQNPLFEPSYSTFEPTKKENNVPNVNTIPGEDVIYFDCRLLPEHDCEKFIGEARELAMQVGKELNATITVDIAHYVKAAPPTPKDCSLTKSVALAIKEVNNVTPQEVGIGGNTVAQQFRSLGVHAAVCSKLDDMCHQPNEYCVIDNMVADTKVWAHVVLQQ